jgi:acyl-CoA synthetase (AMP-forming)/AMP-acid ligase II
MSAPTLLHDLLDRAARTFPDTEAVGSGSEVVTYRWIRERSHRLAAWLLAAGVRRGDRVVLALSPDVIVPALLYACSRIGAVFIVLREQSPAVTVSHVLQDAGPVLVLADSSVIRRTAVQHNVPHHGLAELATVTGQIAEPVPNGPLVTDPVCFIYTSGSSGMPKAVVSTHAQVVFAARAIQHELEYRTEDVVYSPLPLSFDYGLYQIFLCTLAGARLQLASAARAGGALLQELSRTGATILPAVPSLAANLTRLLSRSGASPSSLRLLTNTGAAMPPRILAELRAGIPGLHVQLMFGLTECKRAAIMPKDEDLARPGACGRPLPGTEVFAIGDDGERLPAGPVGELVVRGPHVMAGYWRQPELTAQRFPRVHGLFPELRTGDYGWVDQDGYVHFVGRRDDLYKERGFRVSAIEVENATLRVPGVEDAAVVPPTGGLDGATLIAVSALTPGEVLGGLREQLEDVKVPQRCMVVPRLPINGNGKVDRARLAAFAGRHDA